MEEPALFPTLRFQKKAMRKRRVIPGEVHHLYQRTRGGVLLFYTVSDYLVFFNLYCSLAREFGIQVLALCPMVDHIHQVVVAPSRRQLSTFVQQYSQRFAREWNQAHGRMGPLFRKRYGSSAKLSHKLVRSALAYNCNNPVERKLVTQAEAHRWTFLSYARNAHPYSAALDRGKASAHLYSALKEAEALRRDGGHIRYAWLDRWLRLLPMRERLQLTDAIIGMWNAIDYEAAAAYYGSFETMLRAFHDNTGSEYEIPEDHDSYSDAVYADCSRIMREQGLAKGLRGIPSLDAATKEKAAELLRMRTTAKEKQIRKYLHWQV